jgi:hypothetical protein
MTVMRRLFCVGALLFVQTAARAECGSDIQRLTDRRDAIIATIGAVPGPDEENTLNPTTACPKLRELVSTLDQTVNWFEANKQECGIVDAVVASVAGQRDRTQATTIKLCGAAAKPAAPKKRKAN